MRDSRALPGFGQVDLEIEDDPQLPVSEGRADSSPAAFGELDFDLGEADEAPPASASRVFGTDRNTHATRRNMEAVRTSVHDESTRIVQGDALAAITRPPPPPSPSPSPPPSPLADDGNTRAWSEVDDAVLAVGGRPRHSDNAPSLRSGDDPSPSGSGVAPRDDRVAAMRDLYARGDAEGALALASMLGQTPTTAPSAGADRPDASVLIEMIAESSIDLSDPFGGLIPIDDDLADRITAAPPRPVLTSSPPPRQPRPAQAAPPAPTAPPCAAPQLTLTERHSIPRVLKTMAEVSKLKIDHRAGFLLAHVDGMQTLEEILDICAMPPTEALALIANLKAMGVIEFE